MPPHIVKPQPMKRQEPRSQVVEWKRVSRTNYRFTVTFSLAPRYRVILWSLNRALCGKITECRVKVKGKKQRGAALKPTADTRGVEGSRYHRNGIARMSFYCSILYLCMVQFYLLPSPPRATPGTSPALRARGWGIV